MGFITHAESTSGRRESNQDRYCTVTTTFAGKPACVLAVADGMGGMQQGDKAAEAAIDVVRSFASSVLPLLPPSTMALREALEEMVQGANRRVWEFGERCGAAGQVGTTLVCSVALETSYLVANTGDSRCYYINNKSARLLTEDHSQVRELVRSGAMTDLAARRSPYRSQLTSCLGEPHPVRIDVFPAAPNVGVVDEACVLLLCSDGLHAEAGEADLLAQLRGTSSLKDACRNLVSLAFQRGSTDNITAAAVEVGRLARTGPPVRLLRSVQDLQQRAATRTAGAGGGRPSRRVGLAAGTLVAAGALAGAGAWILMEPGGPSHTGPPSALQHGVSQRAASPAVVEAAPRATATAESGGGSAPATPFDVVKDARRRPAAPLLGSKPGGRFAALAKGRTVDAGRGLTDEREQAASPTQLPKPVSTLSPVPESDRENRVGAPLSSDAAPATTGVRSPQPVTRGEATERTPAASTEARPTWNHGLKLVRLANGWFCLQWQPYPVADRRVTYEGAVFADATGTHRIVSIPKAQATTFRFAWKGSGSEQNGLCVQLKAVDGSGQLLDFLSTVVDAVR